MDFGEGTRPKKVYNVIEPNTTRVRIKREEKAKRDQDKQEKDEEQRKKMVAAELQKASLMKMRDEQKRQELKRREEQERRRREEENESNTLSGRFGHMINDLNTNSTNLEFTISGMDLRPAQIKVLISNVQNNSSLKGLTMCRKKLMDAEGCQVADKLIANEVLERLDLEGNNLGPQSLKNIARLLLSNESIRHIDLQGNRLVKNKDDKPNYSGIDCLVEALKKNDIILSINLNSTGLDSYCSKRLREVMEVNSTIIMLDVENNPEMNIDDVIAIQDALVRNKQDYDDERYMEFIQRKRMRKEEDISGVLLLNQQTKKLRGEAIDLNIKTKKAQLDEEWNEFLASEQLKKQKEMIRMEKEVANKKGKKKKK